MFPETIIHKIFNTNSFFMWNSPLQEFNLISAFQEFLASIQGVITLAGDTGD